MEMCLPSVEKPEDSARTYLGFSTFDDEVNTVLNTYSSY